MLSSATSFGEGIQAQFHHAVRKRHYKYPEWHFTLALVSPRQHSFFPLLQNLFVSICHGYTEVVHQVSVEPNDKDLSDIV